MKDSRYDVSRVPAGQLFRFIEAEQIEISWEIDEDEDDSDDPALVVAFPMKRGGCHGYGKTMREAISDCLESNRIKWRVIPRKLKKPEATDIPLYS